MPGPSLTPHSTAHVLDSMGLVEEAKSAGSTPSITLTLQLEEGSDTGLSTELLTKIHSLRNDSFHLKNFRHPSMLTLQQTETEFRHLCDLSEDADVWEKLTEDEKRDIERYKLAIIQTIQQDLFSKYRSSDDIPPVKPARSTPTWLWVLYGSLLVLEAVPLIWGGFLGISALLTTIHWLPTALIAATGVTLCGIQAILYYAVVGPLLQESLGISSPIPARPRLEICHRQYESMHQIDAIMAESNEMPAAEYRQYLKLIQLFYRHFNNLADAKIIMANGFDAVKPMEGKAIIIVGNTIRYMKDNTFLLDANGHTVETALAEADGKKLAEMECDANHCILRRNENIAILDTFLKKTSHAFGVKEFMSIGKFKKRRFSQAFTWILGCVNTALNIGSGYFFALSLLSSSVSTAALIGTPVGWSIIGFVILGQIALRFAVSSNAMRNLLNPSAERHETIREKINRMEPKLHKYEEILQNKQSREHLVKEHHQAVTQLDAIEKIEREKLARNNPYVDSYRQSYTNPSLFQHTSRVRVENMSPPEHIAAASVSA